MSSVKVTKGYIQFNDSSKQSGIFPMIGSIIMWPGDISNIPYGYLICDGRTLDKTEVEGNSIIEIYGKLFEKIGYKYGSVEGDSNKFKLPNMIERFPLGIKDNTFKNVVDSTTLYGGEKKLQNSNFKHKHKIYTSDMYVNLGFQATDDDNDKVNSINKGNEHNQLIIDRPAGDNDDFFPEFNVVKFIIRYTII
jgi:microcystin-dependent protein